MENVRLRPVLRSLCRSRLRRSSGHRCVPRKSSSIGPMIVNHEIKEQLNKKSIKYNWHEADVTVLEGVLARGDRKVGKSYRGGL